jgi:soluble cytochrome b562
MRSFIMLIGTILQEDITIQNGNVPNNKASREMKQKLRILYLKVYKTEEDSLSSTKVQ